MQSPRLPAQPEARPALDLAADFAPRQWRLPAKPSELQRAREYAEQAAASFGFDEAERFELVFAVNEAVTNAIRHGTADQAGTIGLRIAAEGNCLVLDVCDCGRFVAPADEDDDPLPDHGRGFGLMVKLMDDVEVRAHPEGTTVRLGKRRRAEVSAEGEGRQDERG